MNWIYFFAGYYISGLILSLWFFYKHELVLMTSYRNVTVEDFVIFTTLSFLSGLVAIPVMLVYGFFTTSNQLIKKFLLIIRWEKLMNTVVMKQKENL